MTMLYKMYQHHGNTERIEVEQRTISGTELVSMINDDYEVRRGSRSGEVGWQGRMGFVGLPMAHLFEKAHAVEESDLAAPDGHRAFTLRLLGIHEAVVAKGLPPDERSLFAYEITTPLGFDCVIRYIYEQDSNSLLFYFFHYALPVGNNWPIAIAPWYLHSQESIEFISALYDQASNNVIAELRKKVESRRNQKN